jgi:hypothetical protein
MGLGLVHPHNPYPVEIIKLLDCLGHLLLGFGQDQNVVTARPQVTPVKNLSQLLGFPNCFRKVDVEKHK